MPTRTTHYLTRLPFVVDPHSIVRDDGRQIDWDQVPPDTYATSTGVTATVGAAGAAQGATSIPVAALAGPIPSGVTLKFTGADEFATLTAPAATGATSLTVAALVNALESGDAATYRTNYGKRVIAAGTVMSELTSGKIVPRAITTATATCILETAAEEGSPSDALSGYGVIIGGALYENMLPEATGGPPKVLNTTWKGELQTAGVGTGFAFRQYADTRS